jgi:sarcosine oxidase
MNNRFQIVVIGLGGIGSAALYHLAKQGKSTLGIDQFQVPHSLGSTHGGSRITRLANGEGDMHTQLALRAAELWKSVQQEAGHELLCQCGGIIVGNNRPGSFNNKENYFGNTVSMAEKYGIEHEVWDATQARKKLPLFHFSDEETVLYEPTAGFLRPENCINAHLQLAEKQGAQIQMNTQVLNMEEIHNGMRVHTNQGVFEAEQVVLAAGPWIGKVLSEYQQLFTLIRQITFWFAVDDWQQFVPKNFPVFIRPSRSGNKGIYGFPAIDGENGGIKIASEYLARSTLLENVEREVHPSEIEEIYQQDILPNLRHVLPKCISAATCLFTETPDYGFLIDRHPHIKSLVIASPCSGYGFKFASALGETIAQFTCNQKTSVDLSGFSLQRFMN